MLLIQVTQEIIRSAIDFKRDPWPKVSDNAKDLVKKMLNPDPKQHLTVQEVLEHPWLQNAKKAPNVLLGETVKARVKQFSIMYKLKKRALRGPGAGTSSNLPTVGAIADSQSSEETRPSGWSSADPTHRRHSGLIANSRSLAKQKGPVDNDLSAAKDPMVIISIILYFVFGL
ncbi:hypothetical protein ES332_A01G155800v1 [Gossypium tomentosum]|uniref:Protein kinase domain-containing protein n=1 Tax=Gossypium tomentosum TaxID=34277 RepID=A0A5D2RR07_GOSTO|nr:hypothetical protein ES332_A01G155800v1 [Gossypium tomentosum]